MPENGKMALTRRELDFLRLFKPGEITQVEAARQAGYSERSAAQSANRVLRKISRTPSLYWVNVLNLSGADLVTLAKRYGEILNRPSDGKGDKNIILLGMQILSAHGIGSTKDTSESNTFNIQGPVMIIQGEEEKRAALREGAPKLEAPKPEDAS